MRKDIFCRLCLLFAGFFFIQQSSYAQFEEGKEEIIFGLPALNGTGITSAASNTTTYAYAGEDSGKTKIKNIITFKINENSTVSLLSNFTATVYLKIKTKDTLTSSYDSTLETLTVNYDNAVGAKFNVRAYLVLPRAEVVTMIVDSIHITGYTGSWNPINVLQLENEMRILRYFTLSDNPTYLTPSFNTAVNDTDAVVVSWVWNSLTRNNMTQLEWAWVEDSLAYVYTGTDSLFENNSTRVDLDYLQNEYYIPLLYDGEGKLYYRVRAVVRKNNGTLITGPWSGPQNFAFDGHEPDMNWQSSTSFAENGKLKSVIQYYDGSLRSRQTVTKDNTNGNTVVAETIYDLQGRPNIQILPTPTISTTIKYFQDFNRFLGQQLDGAGVINDPAKYFDLIPAASAADFCNKALSLDSNYGNGKYYSNQNPWKNTEANAKFIPDAKGFAFTETRFMDDATERVRSQGGVGIDHQIGSGHETKYYYGKPAQQELDALFATEVGDAAHYSKNMIRDANGQMSVSYVDMHGRTIATALAGDTTTGISTVRVDTTDYPLTSSLTNQLATPVNNVINGNAIESISTILVPTTTVYNFVYKLDPSILSLTNCSSQSVCFDCKYDLEISIKSEECGDTTPIIRRYNNLQIMPSGSACDTSRGFTGEDVTNVKTISFSQTLGIGSWVIRKTLTINDSMYQVRRDSALKALLCKTEQQIYDSVYAILYSTSGCGNPPTDTTGCSSCLTNLGTANQYRLTYLASIDLDSSNHSKDIQIAVQYTQDSIACANACGGLNVELTSLQSLRRQMMSDMVPFNGQYAVDSVRDPVTEVATALTSSMAQSKYNIFTTSPAYGSYTKPFYKHPLNENGQAYYYTEDKQVDSMIHRHDGSGQPILDTISRDGFSTLFQHAWASSLIKYHPEYSKLRIAEDSLKRAYEWLDSIQAIDSYSIANSNGFDNPLSLPSASAHPDPFFQMSNNAAHKTTMNKRITQGVRIDGSGNASGPTIWQLANGAVLCAGVDSSLRYACTKNLPEETKTGISSEITDASQRNRVWEQFRALYLSYRNEMVLEYINGKSGVLSRAGMDSLLAEGKQLVFANMNDIATQNYAGSWWPTATSNDTTHLADSIATIFNTYNTDKCLGQKPFWKARLLQCEALINLLNNKIHNDSVTVNQVIDSILVGMVSVCRNSTDANHYYGASNVKPSYGGNPKDFEKVINPILKSKGIDTLGLSGYFCNPYTIDFPKPYGKNPPLFTKTVGMIDTCGCNRFAAIKTQALASSVDTSSMSAMNTYLLNNYGDTVSTVLWTGLRKCKYVTACDPGYIAKYNIDKCDTSTCFLNSSLAYTSGWVKYRDIFPGGAAHIPDSVYSHVTSGASVDSANAKSFALGIGRAVCVPDSFTMTYRLKTRTFNANSQGRLIIIRLNLKPSNNVYYAYIGQNISSGIGGLYKGGEGFPPQYNSTGLNVYFSSYKTVTVKFADSTLKIYIDGSYVFQRPCNETITSVSTSVQFSSVDGYIDYVTYRKLDSTVLYDEQFNLACYYFTKLNRSGYDTIPLPEYTTWPAFLNCGYVKPCITCGKLDTLTTEFRNKFPTFNSVPYLGSTLTQAQSKQNGLWARFLNYRTGFSKNVNDYLNAYNNCHSGTPPANAICSFTKALNDPSDIFVKDTLPCKYVQTQAEFITQLIYQKMKDSLIARFDSLYKAKCFSARNTEQFYAIYQPKEYHYTLYYYDQAGNLVKTIPPAAVKPKFDSTWLAGVASARAAGTDVSTDNNDSLATFYRYNSLNQVIAQRTPDAGVSKFWYDRLGRLVVSQNDKQRTYNQYSYTLYDALGRITEVGQSTNTTAMTQAISQSEADLAAWVANVSADTKKQITQTVYDLPYTSVAVTLNGKSMLYQKNLRNRVSYTMLFDDETQRSKLADSTWAGGNSATYYSYDIHGNVDTLLQDYKLGMGSVACDTNAGNRFKKMVYYYDLISGKVNDVAYQPDEPDQFYHRYEYDAENRITGVKTSKDKIYWETDAAYSYYRHGPLSRTVLGQNQVQGLDYAYTIQGWLKGVNSTSVGNAVFDIGQDGKVGGINNLVARDAYGFSLNYFNGDYKPIDNTKTPFTTVSMSLPADPVSGISTGHQLFNGNIGAMVVNIAKLSQTLTYGYRYDQLNRIVRMDAFRGFENSDNSFSPTRLNMYHESVTYDPSGNIRKYFRNGTDATTGPLGMDDLTYSYYTNTNKLKRVTDAVSSGNYSEDIDSQSDTSNYRYDEIGNLIRDKAEGIDSIKWTVYGKISRIYKESGELIEYKYDASGNRIEKVIYPADRGITRNTYYVRDATGNVMSIYQAGDPTVNGADLTQSEIHLYGSNRLGIYNVNVNVQCPPGDTNLVIFTRGNKFFELSNHLGNVLVTVSDKRVGVDSTLDGTIDFYTAEVITANDYYPFGMAMPERKFTASSSYRYGFNGKENDNDISGDGNSIHFEFREYDPRISRFKSIDPRSPDYSWQSPYAYHRNNPLNATDYKGLGDPPLLQWEHFKERHLLSGNFSKSAPANMPNSVVTNPAWQSKAAIDGFFKEAVELANKAGKTQMDVVLSNGTTWNVNVKDGHFYPVKGEGITNLTKLETAALRAAKANGTATGEAIFANLSKNPTLGAYSAEMQSAVKSLAEIEGVSTGTALKHIGGNMPATNVSQGQTSAASSKFGSASKYIKWGTRTLLVVAVASDIYEVYNSENKPRTITKKVGGWAAAGASAAGAGVAMSWFEAAPGPGTILHGIVTIGAGIGGYFAGEYVTETVYDWIFTKEN